MISRRAFFDNGMSFTLVNDICSVHHIINRILGHKIGNTDGMPDSTHIEEANALLLESESDYRSSFEYSPDAVDFERNGDSDNPLEWPTSSKWSIVALLSLMGFTITFTCISIVPVAGHITDDLNGGQGAKSATVMLVTIWELGEAIGPLFIAPLSEIFGRYRLYLTMNTMFIMAILLAALSPSAELLIVSRALMGISAASNVLNPAIIGDIFVPEQRGTAISLIMFVPLMGGTVGPVLSGAIVQSLGWRTIIWISVALACICQLLFFIFFRETYKVQILKQKQARLRMKIGNSMAGSEKDGRDKVDLMGLRDSIIRPVIVLFNSSVLGALLLFGSFMFAHFYIVATTLPDILEGIYGLSPTATGLAFIANGLGTVISFIISKVFLDKIYVKLRTFNNGIGLPEYRLPLSIIGALALPPAVILYGWCAEYKLPLPILFFSMTWLRISMMLGSSPLTAYIVDACGIYSASAMAGLISVRCLAGAFLPLSIARLTGRFGYGGGFSVLGAFGMIFALIPVLVLRYGAQWRQRSRYTANTLK